MQCDVCVCMVYVSCQNADEAQEKFSTGFLLILWIAGFYILSEKGTFIIWKI